MKIFEMTDETWDEIVDNMDEAVREQVDEELGVCNEQEFLDRYLELDPVFETLLLREFSDCFDL